MNQCLITGFTGFIGKYILQALMRDGLSIHGLSRSKAIDKSYPRIELTHGDLTRPESIAGVARGIDTIIHVAGHAHTYRADAGVHRQTTLEGTRNLLADAERHGVRRFVFISSVKAMPDPGKRCLDETAQENPADEYGLSRRQAEELVLATGRRTGMHVVILRPALVYGPGCKGNLAGMLRWIDKGLFPPVPETGNRRSMVDVRDLVSAVLLAVNRNAASGGTYIITDGVDYSTRRIYLSMCSALGKRSAAWSVPPWLLRTLGKVGDISSKTLGRPVLFDSTACSRLLDSACYRSVYAEDKLGFRPGRCLEDTLPEMVAEYRQAGA